MPNKPPEPIAIFDKPHLDSLRRFSKGYFHGHSVGGTNPALLEAMAAGAFIIAHDNVFNRDVLGQDAYFFKNSDDVEKLIKKIDKLTVTKTQNIKENKNKIRNKYSHQQITNQYIQLIQKLTL